MGTEDDTQLYKALRDVQPGRFAPGSVRYATGVEEPVADALERFGLETPSSWARPSRQTVLLLRRTFQVARQGGSFRLLLGQAPAMALLLLLVLGTDNLA